MASNTDSTQRIARSSAAAATGYATAAMAAYVDMTRQVMGYWANTIDTMTGKPEPRSWYRHPDSPERSRPFGTSGNPWMPMAGQFNFASPVGMNPYAAMFNPFSLWMKAWPLQGNPAAWPMAFMMMGMGVSRSVAYPLAEANTAALDAVNTAANATNEAFSRYRSFGGHATAQIRIQPISQTTNTPMMTPFAMQMLSPWFCAFMPSTRTP